MASRSLRFRDCGRKSDFSVLRLGEFRGAPTRTSGRAAKDPRGPAAYRPVPIESRDGYAAPRANFRPYGTNEYASRHRDTLEKRHSNHASSARILSDDVESRSLRRAKPSNPRSAIA